ncbi:MAG TPA: hypothetical protein VEZ12_11965 [Herpetosiphonaceae bacterium]|nr:hypothetical protein [Herpetosiphonaceae bacterium]
MYEDRRSLRLRSAWLWLLLLPLLALSVLIMARSREERGACFQLRPATVAGQERDALCWALIGNTGQHLEEERAAGVGAKVWSLSWREYFPEDGVVDRSYLQHKHAELTALRQEGFAVILSLGFHDTPRWVHSAGDNTYYVNQYGDRYNSEEGAADRSDANLVFNRTLRPLVAAYVRQVFAEFGGDFAAVRLGGGRFGELTYPSAEYNGKENSYWAFDASALAQSPVPEWRPGDPSPNGEAGRFLSWYHSALTEFQTWQITMLREHYDGAIMLLYPSWGIRPGDVERAIAQDLDGSTAAERNGEIQRGYDFAAHISAIGDPDVIVTTTWLDADASRDGGTDQRYWSPVKYLARLAADHPLRLAVFGENTGHGDREEMEHAAAQAQLYGLRGMAWFNAEELWSGRYATLDDYRLIIQRTSLR